jgi:hypothetical protein
MQKDDGTHLSSVASILRYESTFSTMNFPPSMRTLTNVIEEAAMSTIVDKGFVRLAMLG